MQELLTEALRPVTLPFTVLLGAVVIYWLLAALGAAGFDLHADHDGGGDVHHDAGSDGDSHGPFGAALDFINVGEVPLTIVLSVYTLCIWALSMVANFYWVGASLPRALVALAVALIVSAIVTRYVTAPFKPLIRALNRPGEEHIPVVGRTCQITTTVANPTFGQALIETKGAPLLINVRTLNDASLPRGTTGLVIKADPEKELYYVVAVTPDALT